MYIYILILCYVTHLIFGRSRMKSQTSLCNCSLIPFVNECQRNAAIATHSRRLMIELMQAWKRTGNDTRVSAVDWAKWERANQPVPGQWSHAPGSSAVSTTQPGSGSQEHSHGLTAWEWSPVSRSAQTQDCCHSRLSFSFKTTQHFLSSLLSQHSSCSP